MENNTTRIKTFSLGSWMTNCYLVSKGDTDACCVIDAGFEPEQMISWMQEQGLRCENLILTHSHLDHMAGTESFLEAWPDTGILIHEAEAGFLVDPKKNLSAMIGMPVTAPPATATLRHGQELATAGLTFKVLHTPGHSPGGICLYCAEDALAFVGDTLFHGSVGRYDFPTSDGEALFASIKEHLLTLPDETRIFPGHGPSGVIGEERKTNPFLKGL